MTKSKNIITRILLLGLLPLLGGTAQVKTAVLLAIICLIIAFITRIAYNIGAKHLSDNSLWILLIAIGLSLANVFYQLLPIVLPFTANYVNLYFLLTGVTPLVYGGCRKISYSDFISGKLIFVLLMLLTSISREFLGQGTILGRELIEIELLPFMTGPIGAFVILGTIGILLELGIIKTGIFKIDLQKEERGISQ